MCVPDVEGADNDDGEDEGEDRGRYLEIKRVVRNLIPRHGAPSGLLQNLVRKGIS